MTILTKNKGYFTVGGTKTSLKMCAVSETLPDADGKGVSNNWEGRRDTGLKGDHNFVDTVKGDEGQDV